MVILFWIIFSYLWQKQIKWPRRGWIYERRVLTHFSPFSFPISSLFGIFVYSEEACFHISFVPFQLWGSCVNLFPISKNMYVYLLSEWGSWMGKYLARGHAIWTEYHDREPTIPDSVNRLKCFIIWPLKTLHEPEDEKVCLQKNQKICTEIDLTCCLICICFLVERLPDMIWWGKIL